MTTDTDQTRPGLYALPDIPEAEKEENHPILVNTAQCPDCRQVLVSMSQHDYRACDCPNEAMVDGGRAYLRRGFRYRPPIECSIKFNPTTDRFYRAGEEPV